MNQPLSPERVDAIKEYCAGQHTVEPSGASGPDELKPAADLDAAADEWLDCAQRLLAEAGGVPAGAVYATPMFLALVKAVEQRNTHEMRATTAEEVAACLKAAQDTPISLIDELLREVARSNPSGALYAKANELAKAVGYAG